MYILLKILLFFTLILILDIQNNTIYSTTDSYQISSNHNQCIANEITINIYNNMGYLKIKLIANNIQHYPLQNITQITQPRIIILNKKNTTTWQISCNNATLNYKKVLNLYGYVHINKITNKKYNQSIITNQAVINLINQNILSNSLTIVHGYNFISIGTKMHGNLQKQSIQLSNKTYTYYDIKQTP